MKKRKINYLVMSALIAAFYAGLTYLMGIFGLAYGPIQFRVSEILTILPIFTSAAIPGLTVGCFIANIMSFNLIDMIFGTLATLLAAIATYYLRKITFKGIPYLAILPPVLFNAVIVGLEISVFYTEGGASLLGFVFSALTVGIGQLIICYGLGIPFYLLLNKYDLFNFGVGKRNNNT